MIKEITVSELKAKIDNKDKMYFVDCREQEEWDESHIDGAILFPLSELEKKYEAVLPNKNTQVVIQCRSGRRSMTACMFLLSKGYTDLVNVEGGILAWSEAGYPVK